MPALVERLERRELLCAIGVDGDAFHPVTHAQPFGPSPALVIIRGQPAPVADGTWQSAAMMPHALAEVAAGVIEGKIYVVGELDPATFIYDIASNTWSAGAARPFPGNHHAAEVVHGKLYLFGGLTQGSEGKVQIYDPVTDAWSVGADMPFAAGSSSTALIGGMVYVAGGIVGGAEIGRAH